MARAAWPDSIWLRPELTRGHPAKSHTACFSLFLVLLFLTYQKKIVLKKKFEDNSMGTSFLLDFSLKIHPNSIGFLNMPPGNDDIIWCEGTVGAPRCSFVLGKTRFFTLGVCTRPTGTRARYFSRGQPSVCLTLRLTMILGCMCKKANLRQFRISHHRPETTKNNTFEFFQNV